MAQPLRAYVCSSRMSPTTKGPYRVGSTVRAPRGILVALALDASLLEYGCWPIELHEVEVAPDQILQTGEFYLLVQSFRVLRAVPASDVFGPRAQEIVGLFDELKRTPWLLPRALPDEAHAAELVRRHYAAIAAYAPVDALPLHIVTTWDDAWAADNAALKGGPGPRSAAVALDAVRDAVHASPAADVHALALRKAMRVPFHVAYPTIWEAGWRVAGASLLATAAKTSTGDARVHARTLDRIRRTLADATDRCRRKAWKAVLEIRADEDVPGSRSIKPTLDALALESGGELAPVWLGAWNFANAAMGTVTWAAAHLTVLPDEPNPWLPALQLYRMGGYPIDEVDGHLVVFFPPPPN